MKKFQAKFKIFKTQLKNGLTVLVRPTHQIPRVEVQLWYNVGAKDEELHEKGAAHLIEHMIFKGTKKLSETDIGLIAQKLSGTCNAFTSQDYTTFVFRLPSNAWQEALPILADCMQNVRFDEQMLLSEIKAVFEELRMYQDDYQSVLLEKMAASAFVGHPYQYPIVGLRETVSSFNHEKLLKFYKKHYQPQNATLVVVGDIEKDEVFKLAQKHFGKIKSIHSPAKLQYSIENDFVSKTNILYRDIQSSWCCYAFVAPGIRKGMPHIFDIVSQILASGKSSRLYKRLVNEEKLAADVSCFMYDFFDHSLFCISVYPLKEEFISQINDIVQNTIEHFKDIAIENWEFDVAKKRVQLEYANLLENSEKQAFLLGSTYLATQDECFIENYLNKIQATTKKDVIDAVKNIFISTQMHRGILAKIPENQKTLLTNLQHKSVAQDAIMLAKNNRKTKVEKGKVVNKISIGSQIKFTYPKPKSFELKNGLHFIYHDNRATPQISLLLNLKTSYLYDAPEKGGLFALMMQIMIERTALRTAEEMAQYLETRGIYLNATSETISIQCLNQDFESALKILNEVLTQPSFDDQTIEKIKQRVINELQEYWDTPLDFVDQLARELHYQQHPYSKNPLGSIESISKITKEDLQQCYKNFISPQDASAVIVGSLEDINLPKLAEKIFNTWVGPKIPSIQYSQTPHQNTQNISHPINRDQVVLAFIAPSVSRTDKLFNTIAILDIIITGGANGNFNSRLFALREESGLFYTIGGSLLYGAREEPGMMFIKTVVSSDKVGEAQKKVLGVLKNVGKLGVTKEEFAQAKNQLLSSTVELFESNIQMASTFLFLKKFNMCLNLFDKLGDILSIIKLEDVNEIASKLCDDRLFSTIIIGKLQKKAKRVVSK